MKWTIEHLDKIKGQGKIKGYKVLGINKEEKKKKSKFNNKTKEWDGECFDSKREYQRYRALLLLLKAGAIGQLKRQVPFELNEGGTHSYKYIADFTYVDSKNGETVTEDCKGFRTTEYRKKKRLMLKVHGITIKET